jgi:hypothetical protein
MGDLAREPWSLASFQEFVEGSTHSSAVTSWIEQVYVAMKKDGIEQREQQKKRESELAALQPPAKRQMTLLSMVSDYSSFSS